MDKKQAIKNAGSAAKLARLCGVTQGAVSQWGDSIPKARLWQLKVIRPRWFKDKKDAKCSD